MLSGSLAAIVTPMFPDGALDEAAFDALVDFHAGQGTDGLVVAGTTGESPTLTPDEKLGLFRRAVERARGRLPVVAGTGSNSTAASVELTRGACRTGVDAVLVVTPYYNKPTQEGLYRHFSAVADASAVPVILYNVPGRTGCDLLPATVARLAAHPRIAGIKEATAGIDRPREIRALCGGEFLILSGDDPTACDMLLDGGHGVISVTANVAPALMHAMCAAALDGDAAAARAADERLRELHVALFVESNPIPLKWVLAHMGLIRAGLRLPLTPLDPRHMRRLESALAAAGVPAAAAPRAVS
ncbi:MAG TPA: 4-hydroxy-tetrahydrodipicolinate synthase [Gammaproteobacteria bacterium]|nr:4-hydroxy-tetrahydrodipicolinate synthase [Gammaproteobacteria bacterium]